ncbi:lysophospholipid acyltransferase family protein [Saccharopolyspora sp. CA-218241]|uniref:lysophospholipid acyltransferase family protein n=1 Tax=Saccharopolyspora sp. CA-218241 TaxID=3240027 RepID=UPI003D97F76E
MTGPWSPVSPCGPTCLPDRGREVPAALVLLRLAVLIGLLPLGVLLALLPAGLRRWWSPRWFRAVLRAVGVRWVVRGTPPERGELVVAHHVSWLDVVLLQAVGPLRMVAKAELRDWPLLGGVAHRFGVLFLHRDRLRALPGAVAEVSGALRSGAVVGAFPEGTTWCGRSAGRFRPALFQAALDAGAPVRPVALRYLAAGAPTTAVAFVGEASLLSSVLGVARCSGLVAEVVFRPPCRAEDRRGLARSAQLSAQESALPV